MHPPQHLMLWAGDFNKHHPMWAGTVYPGWCERSRMEWLLQLLASYDLELALPARTLTYESDIHYTWSTIDLVFCMAPIGWSHVMSALQTISPVLITYLFTLYWPWTLFGTLKL
jgi:hypothetical protein